MGVTRIIDGGEPPLFEQYFSDWNDNALLPDAGAKESNVAGT